MKKNVFYLVVLMLFISVKGFALSFVIGSHARFLELNTPGTGALAQMQSAGIRMATDSVVLSGDLTQGDINILQACISSINIKFVCQNLTRPVPASGATDDDGVGGLDNFLDGVTQNGSIIIRNCPYMGWIGQGKLPKHIMGDLILDSIPIPFPDVDSWATNTSFGDIEQVDGDLIIGSRPGMGRQFFNTSSFLQLKSVGGSFRLIMDGVTGIWNIPAPNLVSIGGDLELRGPEGGIIDNTATGGGVETFQLWSTDILENVQYIGGDVTIVNCPRLQVGFSSDDGKSDGTGYCFVRYLINIGVINYACHNVILGSEDDPVDLSEVGACMFGDAGNMDDPNDPNSPQLPDKGSCTDGIPSVKAAPAFATVQPTYVTDNLNITSTANLAKVDVISLTGQTVKSFTAFTSGENSFPVSNLTNGIYLVRLVSENNEVQTVKIIKQ